MDLGVWVKYTQDVAAGFMLRDANDATAYTQLRDTTKDDL